MISYSYRFEDGSSECDRYIVFGVGGSKVTNGLTNLDYEILESVLEKLEFIGVKNGKRNKVVMMFMLS